MTESAGSVSIEVRADLSKLKDDLNKIKIELETLEDKGEIKAGSIAKAHGGITVLEGAVSRFSDATISAFKNFANVTATYETHLNKIRALTGASTDDMEKLSGVIMDLGEQSVFTSTQVAEGAVAYIKQGGTLKDMLEGALKASVDLAVATDSTLTPAVDAVHDSMRAFGIKAGDTRLVVDSVASSVNNTKFTLVKYKQAMAQAATMSSNYGLTMHEFATAIGVTSKAFHSGSDAGTSFKNFLAFLVPKSDEARKLMDELGMSFFTAEGKVKNLAGITEELTTKLGGLNDQARLEALKKIFGVDAIRTAIELMKAGTEGVEKYGDALLRLDSKAIADIRMQGLAGAIERLSGSLENLSIAIGNSGLVEMLTDIVNGITEMVDWFGALPKPILKVATLFIGLTAVLAPLVATIGLVVAGLSALGGGAVLGTAAAIAAVIAAVLALGEACKMIAQILNDVFVGALKILWQAIVETSEKLYDIFIKPLVQLYELLVKVGKYLANDFVGDIKATWEYLTTSEGLVKDLTEAWRFFTVTVPTWVKKMIGEVWNYLVGGLSDIADKVKKKLESVGGYFYKLYDDVVGHSYVPDMVDGISKEFDRLDKEMVDKSKKQTDEVKKNFEKLADSVADSNKKMNDQNSEKTGNIVENLVKSGAPSELSGLNDLFEGLFGSATKGKTGKGGVGSVFDTLGGTLAEGIQGLFGAGLAKVSKKSPSLGNLLGTVFDSGKLSTKIGSSLGDLGKSLFGGSSSGNSGKATGSPMQIINFNMDKTANTKTFMDSLPQMASATASSIGRAGRIY